MTRRIVFCFLFFALQGCTSIPSVVARVHSADLLAAQSHWHASTISAGAFHLRTYGPEKVLPVKQLAIYVEGDGFAWFNASTPSSDPTPINPLALRLALAQPGGHAVYLARPCQYQLHLEQQCTPEIWTHKRFSSEVVSSTNQAVEQLKQQYGASSLILVGYSGGGAIAALVAARRVDVEHLVTVAGNLDPNAWVDYHHLSALAGSLNPVDGIANLLRIKQVHFAGQEDTNMPPALIGGFANQFPPTSRPEVRTIKGFNHDCCWVKQWPKLWQQTGIGG